MSSQLDANVGLVAPTPQNPPAPKESSGQANEHWAEDAEPQEGLQRLEMLVSRDR
jgi:hypothetical protein